MSIALLTVLLAGVSEAVGQSVVLFANRVKPARFVLSLAIAALLVAAGYCAVVLSIWATFAFPASHRLRLEPLAQAVGLSYAPLFFAFLAALPYAGGALLWGLRLWQLGAMIGGVAAVAHLSPWAATEHVALGWLAMIVVQHAFGKPIAKLSLRIASAAAGTSIVGETAAVRRFARQLAHASTPVAAADAAPGTHANGRGGPAFRWFIATFIMVAAIVVALSPLRAAIASPHVGGIFLRVGLNVVWFAIVAIVVAAFLAPLETLGWWAGWYGDGVRTAQHPPAAPGTPADGEPLRYIVYLDGIAQSSATYTPDIETFLDALERELPTGVRLIRGIMAYSVLNRPLDDDPMYAWFWKLVEALRAGAKTAVLGMFINIRNVMIVAVSADKRYGPLYNLGIAQVVHDQLVQSRYRSHSGIPITLLGYSGGGQMCAETAPLLKRALGAPVEVISLGGVMTGTCPFLQIDRFHHMYGAKDVIEPVGRVMFSSRWAIAVRSRWNRARRRGKITITHLGPVGHQVPGGLLDPNHVLPDGRTALRQTLDTIDAILRGT